MAGVGPSALPPPLLFGGIHIALTDDASRPPGAGGTVVGGARSL